MSTAMDLTIRKSVTVDAAVERAFALFTDGLDDWWPVETHSIAAGGGGRPDKAVFEQRAGGRVYEQTGDERHLWANVTAWDPPHRIGLEWRVNPENPPTDVEITFTQEGDRTRVEIVHSGWERYGDQAREGFDSYNGGWVKVLDRYVEHANA
jgi:uncharacterized protein YndB with AHSA1/START domain